MKRIFIIFLTVFFSLGMMSCTATKADKEESTISEEKKEKKKSVESEDEYESEDAKGEKRESKESEKESAADESAKVSTVVFATHISSWNGGPVRKILTFEYSNNKVLKLTEFSGIRYRPVGQDIEEGDREKAREVFGKNAALINEIEGIDVSVDVGDEEYSQVVTYDYTKLGFEDYNKVRKILGWKSDENENAYNVMSKVAENLIYQGYIQVRKDEFEGSGVKTFEIKQYDGTMSYTLEYKDDAVNKLSIYIKAKYEVFGLESKEEAEARYFLKEKEQVEGAAYNFSFEEDGIVVDASFDLVNGSCEEFRKNDNNFIFKSADEYYMSHIVPQLISMGFSETEVEGGDIV